VASIKEARERSLMYLTEVTSKELTSCRSITKSRLYISNWLFRSTGNVNAVGNQEIPQKSSGNR